MSIRGFNFDTLFIYDFHHYYTVTHLSLDRYSNIEYVKNKTPNGSKHSPSQNSLTNMKNLHPEN